MFTRAAHHTHLGTDYLDHIISQPEPGDWDTQGIDNDHTRSVLRIVDGMGGYETPDQVAEPSQGQSSDAPQYDPTPKRDEAVRHPDHIDSMIEVEDYVPEDNQDFVLGIGIRTPSSAVNHGTGEI